MNTSLHRGFTLIELLLVIGIIAVLAVVVFVALDPSKRFRDARDARRVQDVQSILTAVHESIVDNKGTLPTGLTVGMNESQIGSDTSGCGIVVGGCSVANTGDCVNLTAPLAKYLKSIPTDPAGGTTNLTKYAISVSPNNMIAIKACGAEGLTNVSASR